MEPINVLSLFDGISCGQVALERAGVPVANYFASEIDKHAIKVTQHNYPKTQQLGDVTKIAGLDLILPHIDLLIGGSPCQGFSFAGKQLNFEDPRSALFFEYVRILNEIREYNPGVKFFLENVKMKKEHQAVISSFLGVEPIEVCSSIVSAQVRKRLYWTNIRGFSAPADKGIVIKDILEDGVEGYGAAIRDRYAGDKTVQTLELNKSQKLNSLTTVRKDSVVAYKTNQINSSTRCNGMQPYMQDRVFHIAGKVHSITSSFGSRTNVGDFDVDTWRSLTPTEAERAQTLPDNYTSVISDSQRFKGLGNGWTVDVIVEFFKNLIP